MGRRSNRLGLNYKRQHATGNMQWCTVPRSLSPVGQGVPAQTSKNDNFTLQDLNPSTREGSVKRKNSKSPSSSDETPTSQQGSESCQHWSVHTLSSFLPEQHFLLQLESVHLKRQARRRSGSPPPMKTPPSLLILEQFVQTAPGEFLPGNNLRI